VKKIRTIGCICILLYIALGRGATQTGTVLKQANTRFGFIDWYIPSDAVVHVPPQAIQAAGGNESFPSLQPLRDNGISPGVYPSTEELGVLDYSGVDPSLLAFAKNIASALGAMNLSPSLCVPERSFLATVYTSRISKKGPIKSVYYARPRMLDTGRAEIRFRFFSGTDGNIQTAEVIAFFSGGTWLLEDLWFLGK
jgi:hypothetical protein